MAIGINDFAIIYNPNAHKGLSKLQLKSMCDVMNQKKINYRIFETKYSKHATILTKEIINIKYKNIIVVGGDGTIFEVINGIENFNNIKIGIIPAGTGNDISKMINLHRNIEEIINGMINNKIVSVTYSIINDSYKMLLFSSFGVVVNIIENCRKLKKKNKKSYFFSLIKNVLKYKPKEYTICIDEKKYHFLADFISICNGKTAGGGIEISNKSNPYDKKNELIIVKYNGKLRRILNIFAIIRKKLHNQPNVLEYSISDVMIIPSENEKCCIDGEVIEFDSLKSTICHKDKIKFYVNS